MDGGDLNHIPVRPPPPGRTSNFTNPESRSYQLIILISVLSFLVVAMILMRLYSRLRVTRSSGLDDSRSPLVCYLFLFLKPSLEFHIQDRYEGHVTSPSYKNIPLEMYYCLLNLARSSDAPKS